MICVMLYLGQGFFEVLIAAQAPPHRTPSKVRNPTFPQGIPEIRHRNLSCLQRGTEGQRRYIAVDMQVFDCIGLFVGPFRVHDFASCYFYQVFAVLPRRFHTDGGGKSSRFSTFSKASEISNFPWLKRNLLCSWDPFTPGCQKVHFIHRCPNCVFISFP